MNRSLAEEDAALIWHPFTPQKPVPFPVVLKKASGALLNDETGRSYIDGIASWWVNIHGHAHPAIAAAIAEQAASMEHVIFSGFTHEPAVELARNLLSKLPRNFSKVFYSDNGSTAVEVALKMALQYWHNRGEARHRIIAFEDAYHGDTFGGMSVAARNVFNRAFEKHLFEVIHLPLPVKGREMECLDMLRTHLEDETVAAFIFEPLVLGAAGMLMYEAEILDKLIALCREKKVLTIADEVMTGFGRTGTFFAIDQLQHKPDIVALSKGLTGGFLPLGATACAGFIHDAFVTDDRVKTFFHGHSYTGNPTACAAANASFRLFEQENTFQQIARIESRNREWASLNNQHTTVRDIRCKGVILAVEINTAEASSYLNSIADRAAAFFMERGILLRPLGNVVYLLPPYCITDAQLQQVYDALSEFLEQLKSTTR